MTSNVTHALDQELGDLWFARDQLDERGWTRLYQITSEILLPYRPKELSGLAEERDVYVQNFFVDKAFRLDATPCRIHAGALKHFYVMYLRDSLDRRSTERKYFEQTPAGRRDDSEEVYDFENTSIAATADVDEILRESGMEIDAVSRSARGWLESQEQWVPIYLALHFCPDKEHSPALRTLAQRFRIPSYHSRAEKLGINWKPGLKGVPVFADTMIGRWVEGSLGVRIEPENIELIHAIFKILCFEALNWAETKEPAQ